MYLANDFLDAIQQLFGVDSQLYSILIICLLGSCILLASGTCLYFYFLKRRQTSENDKGQLRQTASEDEESSNFAKQYSDTFSIHENPLKSHPNSPSHNPSRNNNLQVYSNKINTIHLHGDIEADQSSLENSSKCLLGISPVSSRNPSPTNSRNLSPAHSYYMASSASLAGDQNASWLLSFYPFLKSKSFQEQSSQMQSIDASGTLEKKRMQAVRMFNPLSLNRLEHTGKMPADSRSPQFSNRKMTLPHSTNLESVKPNFISSTQTIIDTNLAPTLPIPVTQKNHPSLETIAEVDADAMITTRSSTGSTPPEADSKSKLSRREPNSVVIDKQPTSKNNSSNNNSPTFIQSSPMLPQSSSKRSQLAPLQTQSKEDAENMSKRGKAGRVFLQDNPLLKCNTPSRLSTTSATSGSPNDSQTSPVSHSVSSTNFIHSVTTPVPSPNATVLAESISVHSTTSKPAWQKNLPNSPPPPPPTPPPSIASAGPGKSDKNDSVKLNTRLYEVASTGMSVKEMAARAFLIKPIHSLQQQQQQQQLQSSPVGVEGIFESSGIDVIN